MNLSKTVLTRLAGRSLARMIKHVGATSDISYDPADGLERLHAQHPCIVACWHGQFMLLSHLTPPGARIAAMVARHGDAEVIGEAMRAFDVDLIRGAGAGDRKKDRGGAAALRASVKALKDGASLVMTADVPPGPARIAGMGIIAIAQMSGRPIMPVAAASSRFTSFDTWSRLTINLPYSEVVFAIGAPVVVPRNASDAELEALRLQLEKSLNEATERAYAGAKADITRATPLEQIAAKSPPPPGLPLRVYRTTSSIIRAAAPALLKFRERKGKEDPARRNERIGRPALPRPQGKLIWVHAASVGETNAALPLIERMLALHDEAHLLLTTGTTTSADLAARRLPKRAFHQYIPLDAADYAGRFLDHWRPDLGIFTESEIWPNIILAASERKIPLALINARMSPRSMRRWRRHAGAARPLFSRFNVVLAQNERVARVIRFLGAPNVITAGNLKVDAPPPPVDAAALEALKSAAGGRTVFLAASTHDGEETVIADAHIALREGDPGLLTIIAPRHPDRAGAIEAALSQKGLKTERRTQAPVPRTETEIYIADTIGELGTLYSLAPIAFVGGSLVPHGGQNPIEAVRLGTIVLTGPHVHNFQEFYRTLEKAGGTFEVTSSGDIAQLVRRLSADAKLREATQRNARFALEELSGALAKTLDALAPYLDAATPRVPRGTR